MASQHILATAPSQDAILNSLLELVRAYNARKPRLYVGLNSFDLDESLVASVSELSTSPSQVMLIPNHRRPFDYSAKVRREYELPQCFP